MKQTQPFLNLKIYATPENIYIVMRHKVYVNQKVSKGE